RQVDANLRPWLARLGEDTARLSGNASDRLGKLHDPAQHAIGAFLRLHGQDQPPAADGRLPDIEPAHGAGDLHGAGDIRRVRLVRRAAAERPLAERKRAHDLVRALDLEALLLELSDQEPEQVVVTLAGGHDYAWHSREAAEVRAQLA